METNEMKKWLKKLWKDSQETGYTFRKPEELTEPERLGFVEVNRAVCDERDTMFAVRITPTGMDFSELASRLPVWILQSSHRAYRYGFFRANLKNQGRRA